MSSPNYVFYGYDGETIAEMFDDVVKVEWAYIGEGYNGDYNPNDPSDEPLLRFYVYRFEDGDWIDIDDASYCTNIPLSTPEHIIKQSLAALFDNFRDALDDPYTSVKKLGEQLSWISVSEFE